jgi:ribonuclease HII
MDTFEKIAYQEGYQFIAGVDEVGRGPLAGPVVAAAVILPPDYVNTEIDDSKKLPAAKREKLYKIIHKDAVAIGTGIVDTETIDHINILRATLQAMREAVLELPTSPDFILIDGLHRIPLITPQKPVVKGDSLSIIASFPNTILFKIKVMELKNIVKQLNNSGFVKFIVNHSMSKI